VKNVTAVLDVTALVNVRKGFHQLDLLTASDVRNLRSLLSSLIFL
jgi:hypothetical protein